MSRPMLYATLAVLFAILIGTSYALQKQTAPAEQPKPSEMPAEQKEEMRGRMEDMQKQMMAKEKESRQRMMAEMKKREVAEKEKEKKLAALGVKNAKKTGIEVDGKWFTEYPDGTAGVKQAVREKELRDKLTAEMHNAGKAAATTSPAPVPAK